MKRILTVLFLLPLLFSCSRVSKDLTFSTSFFQLSLNKSGSIHELLDTNSNKNVLAKQEKAPLFSIRVNGEMLMPLSVEKGVEENTLVFTFQKDVQASILITMQERHLKLELIEITRPEQVELIVWDPIPQL